MSKITKHNDWLGIAWISFFIGMVLIPVFFTLFPAQVWRTHSAKREYESGNDQKAVKQLREIVDENPDDIESQMLLSKILANQGKADEAVRIAEKLRSENPKNITVLKHEIEILQICNRHTEASVLYDQLNAGKKPTDPMKRIIHLNGLAYTRAVGNRKLSEANCNIDCAIQKWEDLLAKRLGVEMAIDDAIVIAALEQTENKNDVELLFPLPSPTSGWITFYRGSSTELGLEILNKIIRRKVAAAELQNMRLKNAATEMISGSLPPEGTARQNLIELRKKNHRQRESLAMLLTYRAYLLQKLDREGKSLLNREYVLGLGYEPEELLAKLPSQEICLAILDSTSFLDTRGYVRYRLKQTQASIDDLEIALLGMESLLNSPQVKNGKSAHERQIDQSREQLTETLIVLLEHRRLAIKDQDPRRASFDARRLRAMGKQPGSNLY